MLGVGSGNVDEDSSVPEASSSTPPRKIKPQGWKIVLYYLSIFAEKVSAIDIKKLLGSVKFFAGKVKLPKKSASQSSGSSESTHSKDPETATKALSTVDADVEAWLNKISEKASQKSAIAVKPVKSPAKKSVTVKKVAQKSTASKSKRK
jgi:hypothetical protein